MNYPVPVALKFGSHLTRLYRMKSSFRVFRKARIGRKRISFTLHKHFRYGQSKKSPVFYYLMIIYEIFCKTPFFILIFRHLCVIFCIKALARVQNGAFSARHLAYSAGKQLFFTCKYCKLHCYSGKEFRAVYHRGVLAKLV